MMDWSWSREPGFAAADHCEHRLVGSLAGAGLASYRLNWSQMVKMGLVWVVVFLGLYLLVEWFMVMQNTATHCYRFYIIYIIHLEDRDERHPTQAPY